MAAAGRSRLNAANERIHGFDVREKALSEFQALTNILKHAEARPADLTVDVQQDIFILRISDDGLGIVPDRRKITTSHGLSSMRHRVAALSGSWELQNPAPGGTVVVARIPLCNMLARAAELLAEA